MQGLYRTSQFRLAGYPDVFYYPVQDMAEMLNDTGHRNRVFYCQYNSTKA